MGGGVNPWHDVELGDRIEEHFRCVIEIAKGSKVKYELVLENKAVDIDHIRGRVDAENTIRDAMLLYRQRILPTLEGR
jgi:hypothetical protein